MYYYTTPIRLLQAHLPKKSGHWPSSHRGYHGPAILLREANKSLGFPLTRLRTTGFALFRYLCFLKRVREYASLEKKEHEQIQAVTESRNLISSEVFLHHHASPALFSPQIRKRFYLFCLVLHCLEKRFLHNRASLPLQDHRYNDTWGLWLALQHLADSKMNASHQGQTL